MIDVVFAPEAQDDLLELYLHIADRSGSVRAYGYTGGSACFAQAWPHFRSVAVAGTTYIRG